MSSGDSYFKNLKVFYICHSKEGLQLIFYFTNMNFINSHEIDQAKSN